MTDGYFDESIAQTYDLRHDTDPEVISIMVDVLSALAGDGTALEFAIGTGRIALPLAARGTPVSGIELSRAMVDQLRKKDGGQSIEVAIGDMTTATIEGSFSLVFLVYNTIDNLVTQDAQVACFRNAAAHLAPGGRFLIETLVPPLQAFLWGKPNLRLTVPQTIGVSMNSMSPRRITHLIMVGLQTDAGSKNATHFGMHGPPS